MAILSHDDLMLRIQKIAEEHTAEEAVDIIHDLTDTYSDMETKVQTAENSLLETEKKWVKKYTDTFFSGKKETDNTDTDDGGESVKKYTYDSLFKEEK